MKTQMKHGIFKTISAVTLSVAMALGFGAALAGISIKASKEAKAYDTDSYQISSTKLSSSDIRDGMMVAWGTSTTELASSISSNWVYLGTQAQALIFTVSGSSSGFTLSSGTNGYVYSSGEKKVAFDTTNSTTLTLNSNGVVYGGSTIGTYVFNSTGLRPYKSASSYGEAYLYEITEKSTDPEVNLSYTGNSKVMLNKDGSAVAVSGLSASSKNIENPIYKWEIVNESKADMATISGTGATPSLSVSKDGTFEVKVSAKPGESGSYTECGENVALEVVNYGGAIAWSNTSSLEFKQSIGFDIFKTTIVSTMNDDSVVDYGGDYSDFDIYMGDTAGTIAKVTASTVASITSASDLNGKYYKIVDKDRDIESDVLQINSVSFLVKADFTLTSVANLNEIAKGQSIYLKPEITVEGWGDTVSFTTESALISVDSNGVITAGNTAGEDVVVTATMENGNSHNFTFDIVNSKTYDISLAYDMASGFNTESIDAYYGASSQKYTVSGYCYIYTDSYSNDWITIVDDPSNPSKMLQLYQLENETSTDESDMVNGGLITATGNLNDYMHGGNYYMCDGTIDSYTAPTPTSISLTTDSANNDVYINETLTVSVASVVPSGATTEVTWSVDDEDHAAIDDNGEFMADQSGVYTVTATSVAENPDTSHTSADIEITVFEYQETVLTLKAAPKTTYFVGETVESGLVESAVVKYKAGSNLNYKVENLTSAKIEATYKYNGAALTDNKFSAVNESGATLLVDEVALDTQNMPTSLNPIIIDDSGLSVANVVVHDIEIDLEQTTITPTVTEFGFGGTFTHAGTIHIVYKNGYGSRDVALDSTDVDVSEPNMKRLGVQSVTVEVDDIHVGIVEIGSYDVTITNRIDTNKSEKITINHNSKKYNPSTSSWSYLWSGSGYSSSTSFPIAIDSGSTQNAGTTNYEFRTASGSTIGQQSSKLQLKANGSFYNYDELVGLSHLKISVTTNASSASIYLSDTMRSTASGDKLTLTNGTFDQDITSGKTFINITCSSFIQFTVEITMEQASYTAQEQAIAYAQYFNREVGNLCDVGGNTSAANVQAIKDKWSTLKSEYTHMSDGAKDYFVGHLEQEDIARTMGMYERIVARYGQDNFIADSQDNLVINAMSITPANNKINNTAIIVVITSLVVVSVLSTLLILKKKKEQ